MRVALAADQAGKLVAALRRAGIKEIGGQLFGEQLAPSEFRVTELTVQSRPGTFARFVVDLLQAAKDAVRFFDRTDHRYTRYNYIGEWHSHPSFAVQPSRPDVATMRDLVRDSQFAGTFAVLMIVRLDAETLTVGAWVFDPQGEERAITLEVELEQQ
ncbi:Mov34/MPN/PAD-1 family protein [Mesorhizobium sp. B1-1-8]|uniref:Mov34/MPN/PAD-1 family protein n=1 Tax=Mesorhizobium sp. B1-1-8 TaxID=2589976 RepID=UPI0011290339|nr:Mov34/MPN/PAD-1 family protein [Mesorhizobium sp. B1-1-8]UCI05245.1 Mov34/MPN/PAD-1 family protein [Mesorhizobium sp. B1-1-8]